MTTFGILKTIKPGEMYGGTRFDRDRVILDAEPHVMSMARKLFDYADNVLAGGKFTHKIMAFSVNNMTAKNLLWFTERYPLDIEPELHEKLIRMADAYDKMLETVATADEDTEEHYSPEAMVPALQLREHQIRWINMANTVGRTLLADMMGLGKAQPVSEPVMTPDGWKEIGSLQVGDLVIGSSGKPVKVLGVYPQGAKEVFEVCLSDGSKTRACAEHLWSYQTAMMRYTGSINYKTQTTAQIKEWLDQRSNTNNKHFIPVVCSVSFDSKNLPIHPYLLGVLLGDGGITHSVMVSSADQELLERIEKLLPEGMSIKHRSNYDYAIVRPGPDTINELKKSLTELGLFGARSEDKFVPKEYLFGDIQQRADLLRGLLDTDGTVSKDGCIQFNSASQQLAEGVVFLARSLGCVVRTRTKKIKGYLDSNCVQINPNPQLDLFYLERKRSRTKKQRKYLPAHAIKTIKHAGYSECVCIKVDAPDHLYVTNDFILTHNTFSALGTLAEPDARPAIVVCPPHLCLQWDREAKRLFPKFTTHVIPGFKNYDLPKVDLLITSYNRLSPWQDVIVKQEWQTTIFDEAQELRKLDTAKRFASRALSMSSRRVFGLSGTPIINYGIEIWSVLDVIKPDCLGTEREFSKEYCVDQKVSEPAVLNSYLKREGLMLRRTPEDVGLKFGEASKFFYTIDSDLQSLKDHKEVMKALALSILSMKINKNDPDSMDAARDFDYKLRKMTGIAKAKSAAQFVRMMVEQGEKVVLAGWHRDVYDIWLKELADLNPVMYTGTEGPNIKARAAKTFVEDDECKVFIISLRSGAGLDGLQYVCRNVVFGELDWSPHIMDQLVMRVDRDGQTQHPQAFYLAINDGSDPFIMKILNAKRSQHDGLIEGKENGAEILQGHEIDPLRIQEMAKNYLESIGEEIPEPVEETGVLGEVAAALRKLKVSNNSEEEIQLAVNQFLPSMLSEGIHVEREAKVSKRSRVDFMVTSATERIVIEIKKDQTDRPAVYRQVRKYVKDANITSLILFAPWFGIPSFVVDGVPVIVVDYTQNSI